MSKIIQTFLANEERASTVLIVSATTMMIVGFIVAVGAILVMK